MKSIWKALPLAVLLSSLFSVGCGDTFRPVANPVLQPGGDPSAADVVASLNQNIAGQPGSVTEINVSGDTNMGNKPMGLNPTFAAFDGSRTLIFALNPNQGVPAEDNVTATSVSNNTQVTTTLLAGSHPVYITPGSGVMYTANTGANSDCPTSGSIGVLSNSVFTVTKSICVGQDPEFVIASPDNRRVFVLDKTNNQVWTIDAQTKSVSGLPVTVGSTPIEAALSLDTKFLYILNRDSNDISILATDTSTLLPGTISTGGTLPIHIVTDSFLNRLYVLNSGSNTVSVFDISSPAAPVALHAPIAVGASPTALAVKRNDGSRVFVANSAEATVTEINAANFSTKTLNIASLVATPAVPGLTVTGVVSAADGSRVYASFVEPTNLNNGIAIIRTLDDTLVTTIGATLQDPSCIPSATVTCSQLRQRPIQLFR